jgi:hypothetical protein
LCHILDWRFIVLCDFCAFRFAFDDTILFYVRVLVSIALKYRFATIISSSNDRTFDEFYVMSDFDL